MKNQIHRSRICLLSIASLLALSSTVTVAQVKVTTVVGGFINDGQPGTSAALQAPTDVASDTAGNLYISDNLDQRIRKLSKTGVMTTIAGTGISGYSGDKGLATKAMISFPRGIVVDSKGNIIFCDAQNNRIRKISPAGIITTIAGTGVAGFGGDGGPATSAKISFPIGLSLDGAGNLYFADLGNERIRKVDTAGIMHTVAGNGTAGFSGDGKAATLAALNGPRSAVVDSAGNLYIADRLNQRVRKVDTSGIITTFAGNGKGGCTGDGGPATAAHLGGPIRLLFSKGSLYVSTIGCGRVRRIDLSSNVIKTVTGSTIGFDGNGHNALVSQFNVPVDGLFDNTRTHAIIVDSGNNQLRSQAFATTNLVTRLAGGYTGNGLAGTKASLNLPESVAFDAAGNMYIAEPNAHRVRKMTPAGIISTFAGTGVSGYSGDNGKATSATLYFPNSAVADKSGNVYIADTSNGVIRKVDGTGTITTFATNANFTSLAELAVDSLGDIYASDAFACVVWKITPTASVTVAAGVLNVCGYNSDGIAATSAYLNVPYQIAFDSKGNLYIADYSNNRVRKVSSGVISTVAGNGACGFSGDNGQAKNAMICGPSGVAVDSSNFYIGDYLNSRVRKVTSAGIITTLAGTGKIGYNGDGLPATSTNVDGPTALGVSPVSVLYVADDGQFRVRRIH